MLHLCNTSGWSSALCFRTVLWTVDWIAVDADGARTVPAFEFLLAVPLGVRSNLLAIMDAVRSVGGPDQWRDASTHCRMREDIAHLHECRDKLGENLYRLFLLWQRESRHVVVLDGRTKPNNTRLSDAEYEAVDQLSQLATQDSPPFATVDDFIRRTLR